MADPRPRAETVAILDRLDEQHPNADTELTYRTPFELLIATILSAQSTDARVNIVTPALFAKYPDARALAAVEPEAVEPLIVSTGFFRSKARSIVGTARALVERHGGEVPADMDGARGTARASGARPRTSCWATRSACPACRSIATCFASRIGSASRRRTILRSSRSSCARRCRGSAGRAALTCSSCTGVASAGRRRSAIAATRASCAATTRRSSTPPAARARKPHARPVGGRATAPASTKRAGKRSSR